MAVRIIIRKIGRRDGPHIRVCGDSYFLIQPFVNSSKPPRYCQETTIWKTLISCILIIKILHKFVFLIAIVR